ncbi:hypothetical protein H9Q72_006007 [Fusarium xylarioides]|uniref:L-ornithine N(5)-oxygenase n=1 Tax=Fusarium xylarioides TaxID=221167 RepID=A0A9P7L715_9HYPO|nr:hypothetical protein H9Q72_006007 [Fusarium xylarioides]
MIDESSKSNGDHLGQHGYTATQNGSGENRAKFTLKDTPVENQRPMRVVIVGAGFSGAEIRAYIQDVAERYGANRFIKTSHQVTSATWDSENKVWRLTVKNVKTGETFEDTANILVSAKGGLNQIAWPEIKGLKQFAGKLMYSGAWDESCDLNNKRVGVIGNGSSAIQIVPAIQPLEGIKVTCFARSPTWIIPAFGDSAMQKLRMDPSQTKCKFLDKSGI